VERVISRWGEHGARPEARPENNELFGSMVVEASIDVACTPLEAWRLATDITRIGDSPQCIGAAWIDGAQTPRWARVLKGLTASSTKRPIPSTSGFDRAR